MKISDMKSTEIDAQFSSLSTEMESSLEATVRLLREELRETKEQNELLEFRLLEMQELGTASPAHQHQPARPDGKRPVDDLLESDNCNAHPGVLYDEQTEVVVVASERTIPEDYERSNSHSSVTETRSSCSECSETLSFQESGIFEHHEESRSEVDNQLSILKSQIQALVLRFSEDAAGESSRSPSRRKRPSLDSNDLCSELKACTEQIVEFEIRLGKWTDTAYVTSLEDKLTRLLAQKRELEEERAEMEEAENDIRHECQRLEKKNTMLQHELSSESRCSEALRSEILQLEDRIADLESQLSQSDAHEQRNFELEEEHIQMKESMSVCLKEKRDLQEKLIRMIKELEQFEATVLASDKLGSVKVNKVREGTLVANRIRTLFPSERILVPEKVEQVSAIATESSLVKRVEQSVLAQFERLSQREKEPPGQNDRTEFGQKQIAHLTEENARLEATVSQLEAEKERLNQELSGNAALQRRLDEAQLSEKSLRHRIDELEQTQFQFTEILSQNEKKDKKQAESLTHSREEVTFLHNKSCQLQEELDARTIREHKYKSDIQSLSSKVKLGLEVMEEKERAWEAAESALRSQVSRLEVQLQETRKVCGEAECSNGMLREEVLYLERRANQLSEALNASEMKVLSLKSDLETLKDTQQRQAEEQHLHQGSCHDLDVFAKNEGGLVGVAREVTEVMDILKKCRMCKQSAASKLTEVSDQLNTLTLMLGGEASYRDERQLPNFLLRCESEEHLPDVPPPIPIRRDRSIRRSEVKPKAKLTPFLPILDKSNVVQLKIHTDPRTITYL